MQLHNNFLSLLVVLHVLAPAASVAIPRPLQAFFNLDVPTLPRGPSSVLGLRFYHRNAAMREDWDWSAHVNGRLSNTAYVLRTKRSGTAPFVLESISSEDGDRGIFIGEHSRRAFHWIVPPGSRTRRRSLPPKVDATTFGMQGIAGTIDIMSPTADSPVGERIASLSVSTEPTEKNQFVLNASGVNASTVYLVVKTEEPMQDGTLIVALQVPVFDQAKAEYAHYCTTFDTTQASPLTAVECTNSEQEVTDHSSQIFSYNSTSGVIKPLWLTSAPLPGTDAPAAAAKEEDAPSEGEDLPEESDTADTHTESTNSTASSPRNVSLVFTPAVDASTPIVNLQPPHEVGHGSDASDTPSPTAGASHVVANVAVNTAPFSHTALSAMATAEEAGVDTVVPTMCHGSIISTPYSSAVAAEAPPMLQEPTSSTEEASSTSPMKEMATPTTGEEKKLGLVTSGIYSTFPDSAAPTVRRWEADTQVDEEDSDQNMGDDEDENTQRDETSDPVASNDDAKRAVDTAYVWRFSSSQPMSDDDDFVR